MSFTDTAGIRWNRNEYGHLAASPRELVIRSDSRAAEALGSFASGFGVAYGITVRFKDHGVIDVHKAFVEAAKTNAAEKVLLGAHDWLGYLVATNSVAPIVLPSQFLDNFTKDALAAVSLGNDLYGIPALINCTALIRNTRLAPHSPRTFDELRALGNELKAKGLVDPVLGVRLSADGDPFPGLANLRWSRR